MAGFPPGPRSIALVQGAALSRDPLGWIERQRSRYGNVFSARFPYFGRVVYLAHPDAVKEAFSGSPALMHAGEANAGPLGAVLGTYSLLTLDDEPHMEQRKLLLPPFHGDNVRLYGEVMAEAAAREVETWSVGEELRLREATQRIALEVILRAVFGVREEARRREFERRILPLSGVSNMLIWMPFLRRVPFFGRRSERVVEAVDELIYEEIAERRAAPDAEERGDVLSLLLSARHADDSPMSDQELRDELMTLLGAGHETTATGLAWALERLLRTPAALERLTSNLDDDEYLEAVVKETLRVRPVVTDCARKLTADATIAGFDLPAGTLLLPAIALLNRHPDLWPEPEAFRPERFLEGQPDPYSWIPFGGGVRRCIGAAFAQQEMKIVLREILARVRLRAADPAPEPPRVRHVTIVPARGARVVVEEKLQAPRPSRTAPSASPSIPERPSPTPSPAR